MHGTALLGRGAKTDIVDLPSAVEPVRMVAIVPVSTGDTDRDGFLRHADLQFDLKNPRTPDRDFASEDDVLEYLTKYCDVDELVTSILSSNWVDYEPLIVQRKTNIVLEGNRRLAALRLLTNPATREKLGYRLPNDGGIPQLPNEVRVRWVNDRTEARSFIAFKHINGPFKWDALAKAKYAATWLDEGVPAETVARQIGDTHNTVLRMVNGWRVLEQAMAESFDISDITARRFNFSHLYTALARPSAREFLGLSDDPNVPLAANPIPKANVEQLVQLMGWLFGQESRGQRHVIKSQNPDLNRLVKVLGSKNARAVLMTTRDFARAVEVVEPGSSRFEESLIGAASMTEKALGLVGHFEPAQQPELMVTLKVLATTVRDLRDLMTKRSATEEAEL